MSRPTFPLSFQEYRILLVVCRSFPLVLRLVEALGARLEAINLFRQHMHNQSNNERKDDAHHDDLRFIYTNRTTDAGRSILSRLCCNLTNNHRDVNGPERFPGSRGEFESRQRLQIMLSRLDTSLKRVSYAPLRSLSVSLDAIGLQPEFGAYLCSRFRCAAKDFLSRARV